MSLKNKLIGQNWVTPLLFFLIGGKMKTEEIIEFLASIPIGTYISFLIVITSIIGVISGVVVKLYKIFDKSKSIKEENDSFKELVKRHDQQLGEIITSLGEITQDLKDIKGGDLKKLRHSIVCAGEEAINNGCISIRQLRSLEELFEEYETKYHANGYVKTLMKKVRNIRVIGQLDENDEDIETDER